MTILKSEKLTSLTADRATQMAKVPPIKAEVFRLNSLLRGDGYNSTVRQWERPTSVASITIDSGPVANITTGNDPAEAKRKQEDIERTLRGESVVERPDIQSQLAAAHRQWAAIEDAIEFLELQIKAEEYKLSVQHCATLKPKYEETMRLLYKRLADVHAVHHDLNEMRQDLIDSEIGLHHGICHTMPDTFLDNPRNKWSAIGEFFREGKRLGYVSAVPKAFA